MSKETPREKDDLEAVRILTGTLKDFSAEEQERIIRWTREKLGLPHSMQTPTTPHERPAEKFPLAQFQPQQTIHTTPDIKTFMAKKNPTSDTHFAATVAYYYKFEAPEAERKDSISGQDLQEACRKVGRKRLNYPGQTLRNAHKQGLLDRIEEGSFSINTVGENLVAMTLPGGAAEKSTPRKKALKKATKKAAPEKAKMQKNTKRK